MPSLQVQLQGDSVLGTRLVKCSKGSRHPVWFQIQPDPNSMLRSLRDGRDRANFVDAPISVDFGKVVASRMRMEASQGHAERYASFLNCSQGWPRLQHTDAASQRDARVCLSLKTSMLMVCKVCLPRIYAAWGIVSSLAIVAISILCDHCYWSDCNGTGSARCGGCHCGFVLYLCSSCVLSVESYLVSHTLPLELDILMSFLICRGIQTRSRGQMLCCQSWHFWDPWESCLFFFLQFALLLRRHHWILDMSQPGMGLFFEHRACGGCGACLLSLNVGSTEDSMDSIDHGYHGSLSRYDAMNNFDQWLM